MLCQLAAVQQPYGNVAFAGRGANAPARDRCSARASLHPAGAAELSLESEDTKSQAFARAWARKEACLKEIGTGLSRDPGLDHAGTGPPAGAGPRGRVLGDVAVPDRHAGAFAFRADGTNPAGGVPF
ncbi:4'-phosphopantetheinyl transferase superfamily protein [Streptomyces sp. NPDC058572]|uniref:4'-phosphopantetheinyl transferase superfamily protein n=1 Tax=Streptomyces sp. NPDC058572 TaxID=3346546 RepID=UPI00364810DB